MYILGISCFYHDSAACLVHDGELVAAASEERFTRKRHDPDYPANAIAFCLAEAGISTDAIDMVAFYDKPLLKFERLLSQYIATFPRSYQSFKTAMPPWLKEKLWTKQTIRKKLGFRGEIIFLEHHLSHAASSFLVSPFEEAAILTIDGVGEWATATRARGKGNSIELLSEIHFPHSLGLLYSAMTYYLGFKVNSAEYKVMGLAPYGEPTFADTIKQNLIKIADDGSFKLDMSYFAYHYGLRMTSPKFDDLFGAPVRGGEDEPLEQRHKDLARSIQAVTEEVVMKSAVALHEETGLRDLCMAGGVALNCVANGKLLREGPFDRIFVQPAAGDAGGAVGAAFYAWHSVLGNERKFVWQHGYWGPGFTDDECERFLDDGGVPYMRLPMSQITDMTADALVDQKVVGWFQGRMEFGPRALGARSILADPRNAENRDRVNLKIKFRESFRPFAPSAMADRADEYFDLPAPDPYMLFVAPVKPDRQVIPAVTHIDGTARLQTVTREQNPRYYDLIEAFDRRTGVPVIINTSFNVRGEPIVCSPADAYSCFLATGMDVLVLGNCIVRKQDGVTMPQLAERREFEAD